MAILVGYSGWSYDDWIGKFYPIDLAKKKGEWSGLDPENAEISRGEIS